MDISLFNEKGNTNNSCHCKQIVVMFLKYSISKDENDNHLLTNISKVVPNRFSKVSAKFVDWDNEELLGISNLFPNQVPLTFIVKNEHSLKVRIVSVENSVQLCRRKSTKPSNKRRKFVRSPAPFFLIGVEMIDNNNLTRSISRSTEDTASSSSSSY
jgi:hypothetical protein